jgi:multiple sugar transport system permease protein/putative aldouronate transport system permease protein
MQKTAQRVHFRDPIQDKVFYGVVYAAIGFISLLMIYPMVYIVSSSLSSPAAVSAGKVILWPVSFSLDGYKAVFSNRNIFTGYRNTVFYTCAGTAINVFMTLLAAYPLSREEMPFQKSAMFLFTLTMIFNGGMMPNFILMRDLHFLNTIWAMLIPGAISVYNLILTRTYIQGSIPKELLEASRIDGCNDIKYFSAILLPLCKPVIAVITLYYAVAHWNSYFAAFLYLNDRALFPLQLFLREILISNTIDPSQIVDPELMMAKQGMADLLKYALIVISSVPIMALYPFVQKFFIRGVMLGSVKG